MPGMKRRAPTNDSSSRRLIENEWGLITRRDRTLRLRRMLACTAGLMLTSSSLTASGKCQWRHARIAGGGQSMTVWRQSSQLQPRWRQSKDKKPRVVMWRDALTGLHNGAVVVSLGSGASHSATRRPLGLSAHSHWTPVLILLPHLKSKKKCPLNLQGPLGWVSSLLRLTPQW